MRQINRRKANIITCVQGKKNETQGQVTQLGFIYHVGEEIRGQRFETSKVRKSTHMEMGK